MTSLSRPEMRAYWQSKLGTPVDRQIAEPLDQAATGQLAVEHDDHVAEDGGVLVERPPPSRHMDGMADPVQDDLVPCGEQLDAADAWDDRQIKVDSKTVIDLTIRIVDRRRPDRPRPGNRSCFPSPTSALMISAYC